MSDWITLALESVSTILKMVDRKLANKYYDDFISTKEDYYEEIRKERPDMARVVKLRLKLRDLSIRVNSLAAGKDSKDP